MNHPLFKTKTQSFTFCVQSSKALIHLRHLLINNLLRCLEFQEELLLYDMVVQFQLRNGQLQVDVAYFSCYAGEYIQSDLLCTVNEPTGFLVLTSGSLENFLCSAYTPLTAQQYLSCRIQRIFAKYSIISGFFIKFVCRTSFCFCLFKLI